MVSASSAERIARQRTPGLAPGADSLPYRQRPWVPLALAAADIVTLEVSLYLGFLMRQWAAAWFPIGLEPTVFIGLTAGVLALPFAYYVLGLYPGYGLDDVEKLRRRVVATAIVFGSLLVWDYLTQDGMWSRGVLLASWAVATIAVPMSATWIQNALVRAGCWGTPVIVVGARDAGARLVATLKDDRRLGLVPVGFLDYDTSLIGSTVAGVTVLGPVSSAERYARDVKVAALALPELSGPQLAYLSSKLPFSHVIVLPELSGLPTSSVSPRDLGGILGLEIKKNLLLPHNRVLKRILDYLIAVPAFVFTLPLVLYLSLAIVAISPGNPFFAQTREGKAGRKIRVLKLRTMYRDAEARLKQHLEADPALQAEWQRFFKLRHDPRILPYVGSFLRKSSLDEVPQLFNVLKGDMSLVGPRPFPDYHLAKFNLSFRELRRSVPPGLTGLWQVSARSDGDLVAQEALDSRYIRNWSLWLDLHILSRTVIVVLAARGAR
jgi:Undecaprenyl-phosphate galactose phosphotransferase WbaP